MSDASMAEIANARRDWKNEHLHMYLSSGGTKGHIVDVTAVGGYKFNTTLLLRYTGRKTGKTIIAPLNYGDIGGEVVVVASKGGADHHPAWYLNVRESKDLAFQIATQAFTATWREPQGAERTRVWDFMVSVFPPYKAYQASTAREIPLVMMTPVEEIEIFKAA